ncbi:MAG TPA: Flp family type IVb pilin [Allosphingosinicella sp.]|jgi:pilus assembly protein Flp/PilA
MRSLYKLRRDERGATAIEYALIMAMIFLAMVGAVTTFGQQTISMWTDVAQEIEDSRN